MENTLAYCIVVLIARQKYLQHQPDMKKLRYHFLKKYINNKEVFN
jgi:hypothetical protein